jgi:carbonic anhydrase/acetyltransferase-like protein (isoleucine patch superfamily)
LVQLRADSDKVVVGDGTNIQDGTIIHVDEGHPVHLGNNVTVGHRVLLHSCSVRDGSLIGNGAMVLLHERRSPLSLSQFVALSVQ